MMGVERDRERERVCVRADVVDTEAEKQTGG